VSRLLLSPWRPPPAAVAVALGLAALLQAQPGRADLPTRPTVIGSAPSAFTLELLPKRVPPQLPRAPEHTPWAELRAMGLEPGTVRIGFEAPAGTLAVLIPVCAGRSSVDGAPANSSKSELVIDLPRDGTERDIHFELTISGYEHRISCSEPPRVGVRGVAHDGLLPFDFESPHAASGGGHAVVYVPSGHDPTRPAALLVGLHPWNGNIWTYAAYEDLLKAARADDVVLLFPSGLGNSLYTAAAEDEVLRAIDALAKNLSIDPDRVTIWGASMGGAGATTVGFHHPDRFAAVVSLFGDSKYDLTTYVRSILHDGLGAHVVNALDIVDNARNLPVWLIHGEDDHVSPIAQSAMLARGLRAKGFAARFDRVPKAGHEGWVVSAFAGRFVDFALHARRATTPPRVSYWSVRPGDTEAYGIRMTRALPTGDAFFDIERAGDAVHLHEARGVLSIRLPRGAFGVSPTETPPIVCDDPTARSVTVTWDPAP